MSVNSITSFGNYLNTKRLNARLRPTGRHSETGRRHSVTSLFLTNDKKPEPSTTRHPISKKEEDRFRRMDKEAEENPPEAPGDQREPDGTMLQGGIF